jgi:glycosyltransferase involved in cell wall biosynthesis
MVQLAEAPRIVLYYDAAATVTRFDLSALLSSGRVTPRATGLALYSPQEQALWPWILRRDRVDLFFSPYFALPLLAPVPLVCTVHDLIFESDPAYTRRPWVRLYYRPMMRLALRRASAVVAVSTATSKALHGFYSVDPGRVAVVSEAADLFDLPIDPAFGQEVRRRLGLPARFVLCVGARRPHKNLGAAVRAFAAIQGNVPHSLVVVGRAERQYPDDVAAAKAEAGQGLRLVELDDVSERDLAALYALADVLLMPSLHEGFGLPALEAMMTGTPVIASDRSALPEVVGDGGMLVDPLDINQMALALRQVLLDEALRAALSARALAQAEKFSWQRSAEAMLAVWHNSVSK